MELSGPSKFQDTFAKEILRFNRGGSVSDGSSLLDVTERTCACTSLPHRAVAEQ
jgi:hypothetical protein